MAGPSSVKSVARAYVEQAEARIGRSVANRWTLVRLLGLGGMASVYEAQHRYGRTAALKILHPHILLNPSARRRFLAEGMAANKIQHPGVVPVLDDGEDGELLFLVMELLRGRSLAERLSQDGLFPPMDAANVGIAMLDVLAAAHDRGVVHRDIKPSNVFQVDSGQVKVLDFGVARIREPGWATVTESGVTLGTPAFMAPEQAQGRPDEVDAVTDIWSVGATLFQLLTGRLVHDASTPNAAIIAAATKPAPLIRTVKPELPEALARVIDRSLAFRREDRWPNARAMHRELASATSAGVAFHPLSVATIPEVRSVRPSQAASSRSAPPSGERIAHSEKRQMTFAMLALVALGALAGVAWLWFGPSEPEPAPVEVVQPVAVPPPPAAAPPAAPRPDPVPEARPSAEPFAVSPPPTAVRTPAPKPRAPARASAASSASATPSTSTKSASPKDDDADLIGTRQ